jgi:RNA polymerase sigma-70 factor (ECF subfamily)
MQDQFVAHLDPLKTQLLAVCRHMLWTVSELDDVLQEILLKAYEKYPSFETGTNFRAWLFQIATYTIFNANRKHTREKLLMVPEAVEELDLEAEVTHAVDYREWLAGVDRLGHHFGDQVVGAVKSLTTSERTVFLLRLVAGLSIADTSAVLSMPEGSVMGFYSRARTKLRAHLTKSSMNKDSLRRK